MDFASDDKALGMKYYRVVFGYGRDDFFSIPETDVARAIRAQVNGTIFICDEGTRAGNDIKGIQPDYQRIMGYNRDYQLTGADYKEIGDKVVNDHRQFLQETKVQALGAGNQRALTGARND